MFFVYMYRDPRPTKGRQPVYVGKGTGQRSTAHWRNGNKVNKMFDAWLTKIRRMGLEPIIEIVGEYEIEADAFSKECELILLFGRKDLKTGPLCNGTSGGEGAAGRVFTAAHRERLSAAAKNRDGEAYHTPEFRSKIGQMSKQQWGNPSYRGKVQAAMRVAAQSEDEAVRKGRATSEGWKNPDTRAKRVDGIQRSRTPQVRAQIGAACAALWTPEARSAHSEKMRMVCADPVLRARRAEILRVAPINPPKPIVAIDPAGGRAEFLSAVAAIAGLGVSESVLCKALKGAPIKRGAFRGWKFSYLTPPQLPDIKPLP